MAIDTDNEKLALIEYGDVFQPGMPISADGLDQADKQQLLWGYPGILWEAAWSNITIQGFDAISGKLVYIVGKYKT